MSLPTSDDPWLAAARQAVSDFVAGAVSAEAALETIWAAMNSAAAAGFDAQPYVILSDAVTFPEETEADPATEAAWAAEVQAREPEND